MKTAAALPVVKQQPGQTAGAGKRPHTGRSEVVPVSKLPSPGSEAAFRPLTPPQQEVTAALFDSAPQPAPSGGRAVLNALPAIASVGLPVASLVSSHIQKEKERDELHALRKQMLLQQMAPKVAGVAQKAKRHVGEFVEGAAQHVADELQDMHRPRLLPVPLSQLPDRHPQQT